MNFPTHFTAFRDSPSSIKFFRNTHKKSAELFSVFVISRCLPLPSQQNNQKPTP